jgi:hypothetical protein
MINATPNAIVRTAGDDLVFSFREAVADVGQYLEFKNTELTKNDVRTNYEIPLKNLPTLERIDQPDVIVELLKSSCLSTQDATKAIVEMRLGLSAFVVSSLRFTLLGIGFNLWRMGHFLFPPNRPMVQFNFRDDFFHTRAPEVLESFLSMQEYPRGYLEGDIRRIISYGCRLILCTDWITLNDVDLADLAEVAVARSGKRNCKPESPFKSPYPLGQMARLLTEESRPNNNALKVQAKNLSNVLMHASKFSVDSARELVHLPEERATERLKAARNQAKKETVADRDTKRKHPGQHKTRRKATEEELTGISDPAEYFVKIPFILRRGRPKDWLLGHSPWPGREHALDLREHAKIWHGCREAWISWRKRRKGFETDEGQYRATNILFDYIFCYLPWWIEEHPKTTITMPLAPKDFTRFPFVVATLDVSAGEYPAPFIDLLSRRSSSKNVQRETIVALAEFFEFIAAEYAEHDDVFGLRNNPFNKFLDTPRVVKPNKSTKVPIPKLVYPIFKSYLKAIEAFGQHLFYLALNSEKELNLPRNSRKHTIKADTFSYIPFVSAEGKLHPLPDVPCFFPLQKRIIIIENDETKEVYVPVLTTLRLLMSAVETGQRLQNLQWLDLDVFDSENYGLRKNAPIATLVVSTDKVKDSAFSVPVFNSAYEIFKSEESFQRRRRDNHELVPYEGREGSRFGLINPLFRGASDGPISDTNYYTVWHDLMEAFEEFCNRDGVLSEPVSLFRNDARGTSREVITTPHGCRNTFIGDKRSYLSLEEVRLLIGHGNSELTAFYHIIQRDELHERLEAIERAIIDGEDKSHDLDTLSLDQEASLWVHPESQGSALRGALSRDPRQAIEKHGLVAIALKLNASVEGSDGKDGLSLLLETEMAEVAHLATNMCPVGRACPETLLKTIYEPGRCGLCPLAVCGIDHLPAISSRRASLLLSAKEKVSIYESLSEQGSLTGDESDELWTTISNDVFEAEGWRLREAILIDKMKRRRDEGDQAYHVDDPDLLKDSIYAVHKENSEKERLLRLVVRANEYPTIETPELRAAADIVRRKLCASVGNIDEALREIAPAEITQQLRGMLSTIVRVNGLSVEQAAKELEQQPAIASSQQKAGQLLKGVIDAE